MAEYVCEITQDYPDIPWESDDYSGTVERREEVVRCRDCVHYRPENDDKRTPSRCTGVFAYVNPDADGFCAWGRRRS